MTHWTKRRNRAIPLLLVVMALAAVGVVYAHWTETLTVDAQVNTGSVEMGWTGGICSEFYNWPWPPQGTGEVEGKDVGSTTLQILNPHTLALTITNGYPSYAVDCEIEYTNAGSIPVIIRGWHFTPGLNLSGCTEQYFSSGSADLNCNELTVELRDNLGVQVDPGDPGVASSLRVHVEQAAEENTTFEFDLEVCATNWNEPATAEECFAYVTP